MKNTANRPKRDTVIQIMRKASVLKKMEIFKNTQKNRILQFWVYQPPRAQPRFQSWGPIPWSRLLLPVSYTHLTLPTNREV